MKNQVQLITYTDRLSGSDFPALERVLQTQLKGLFSGVHILPFYSPIDGSDAGFDPINHALVDERLGTWDSVKSIGQNHEIMADLIVNHASAQSPEFLDVLEQGRNSKYWSMFLKEEDIFPGGITAEQQAKIYRPRPGSCFSPKTLASGEVVNFWTTFTDNQIDINVETEQGQAYLDKVLQLFADSGVKIIRLDAAGYAIKRKDSSCFMTPETFAFIDQLASKTRALGMTTVAEIHSYYKTQVDIANKVDQVYDFALPPLILHSLFTGSGEALVNWLNIAPKNCLTVLDTHDGIGIIDVGPHGDKPGLLTAEQIDTLVETMHDKTGGQSRQATGAAASNVDLYQVNSTYYDALGQDDNAYLIARAIQFFAPGVPQVYYAGLLAVENDMALLQSTGVGRDINRPYLNFDKVTECMHKPVVKGLCALINLRNQHIAFNGDFTVSMDNQTCIMQWVKDNRSIVLKVDFAQQIGTICIDNSEVINLSQWATGNI